MALNIIDLIIRLKNGYLARKDVVNVNVSKMNEVVVAILKEHKFIKDYEINSHDGKKDIKISLLYENDNPAIRDVKIVSKPGKRIYSKARDLKPVLGGLGMAVLTTQQGMITDSEARKKNIGGEVLFEVW